MQPSEEALRWDLDDLYRGDADPSLSHDLEAARERAKRLAGHRGVIASHNPARLRDLLVEYEALLGLCYRPALYASLRFSADTGDPEAQALLVRTREASAEISTEVQFIDLEIQAAPQVVFDAWLGSEELLHYRHHLSAARKGAPHTLGDPEEKIMTLKSLTGVGAWSQLFDEVLGQIRVPVKVAGEPRELTVDEARALRSSPDRALRERASRAIHEAHAERSHVLTFIFNTVFQDHKIDVGLRRFETAIAPTLLTDELSLEVLDSLLSTTEASYPLAQEYYRLKARALGLSDFSSHDLLAPLPSGDRKVPYEEARWIVLDAFRRFSPTFAEIAERFFTHHWIDVLPRGGKRGGAFCAAAIPALHPYVLTNYSGRLEDVSTLAHELGHAIHFSLARARTLLNYAPTTPMAETASVFGEILLARQLLSRERDPAARRSLLALRIEDILATVFRQVMYTRWELEAHARRAGGMAPAEAYGALWQEQLVRLYGDAVRLSELDRWGWIGIPHFIHSRFYCYSYAFGQLLVLALYRRYLDEGERFVPRYLDLLAGGGAGTPEELLGRVGIDVHAEGFWQQGFDTLRELIDEFRHTF